MLCYCKCGKQRANFLIVGEAFGFVRDFVVLSGAKRLSCWSRTIVRELRRRGCKIPQEAYTKKPHNVIRGDFAQPGQTD